MARRQWMTEGEFLDLLGATNLIPGPNSTQMALHIGLRRAGWAGLLAAGVCFILPAAMSFTFARGRTSSMARCRKRRRCSMR